MSLIVNRDSSNLKSNSCSLKINDVSLYQNKVPLSDGATFNFVNMLSGIVDVKTKNFTTFFLTRSTRFEDNISRENYNSTTLPIPILTSLKYGDTFLTILSGETLNRNIDGTYKLVFNNPPFFSEYFVIEFLDEEYCQISYDDGISINYIAIENNVAILKKGIVLSEEEKKIRYSLGENKIALYTGTGVATRQLIYANGMLSACTLPFNSRENANFYSLNIDYNLLEEKTYSNNTSYISYAPQTINIDREKSLFNLSNNYLLHRSISKSSVNDLNVVVLKNQMDDLNNLKRSNNVALFAKEFAVNNRNYTSILNDIDSVGDTSLDLNYITNNKSIIINPGVNNFSTGPSLYPFTQLAIQDSKLIESGAYGSLTPEYADKVYYNHINKLDEKTTYLCTWLYLDSEMSTPIWYDRYYYPDTISKKTALAGTMAFNRTFDQFALKALSEDSDEYNINNKVYFDVESNMYFEPSSSYTYERIDLSKITKLTEYNILTENNYKSYPTAVETENKVAIYKPVEDYYKDINLNGGFVLAFNILSQNDSIKRSIDSLWNDVPGGLTIIYNDTTIRISFYISNSKTGVVEEYSAEGVLKKGLDSNLIVSVDNSLGVIKYILNGDTIYRLNLSPFKNKTVLYGDFIIEGGFLYSATDLLSEIFISSKPMSEELVDLLAAKYNDSNQSFVLSLPGGVRNKIDRILQLNSLNSNLKSKSNMIDITVSGLDVDDEMKEQVLKAIEQVGSELLPINKEINNINLI